MTKLVIQIPCYNEEEHIGTTLSALPRTLPGIEQIEFLVVNDGSTDGTVKAAAAAGAHHIVDLPSHVGLAQAFKAGLVRAIEIGADIIVNTDADNQYDARDIPKLIEPILTHKAEFVVGARPIARIEHFSFIKKLLQSVGSSVVRRISGTDVKDAPSGFRAMSCEAALRINIFDSYTYTLESIIQAGLQRMRVVSVPIRVNRETRPSRLIRSQFGYVFRSSISIARALIIYRPGKTLWTVGAFPVVIGGALAIRWVTLIYNGSPTTHVPSLVAAAVLVLSGLLLWLGGVIGEMMKINRMLLEEIQYRLRRQMLPGSRGVFSHDELKGEAKLALRPVSQLGRMT